MILSQMYHQKICINVNGMVVTISVKDGGNIYHFVLDDFWLFVGFYFLSFGFLLKSKKGFSPRTCI